MIILWYLSFSVLKSSAIPVPNAVIRVIISLDDSTFPSLAFSTFKILPFKF